MPAIPLTGLDDFSIGNFVEANYAAGPAASAQTPLKAILRGNLLSTGSGTPDTVIYGPDTAVVVDTEQDVINVTGAGSELHRMWRKFRQINPFTSLYLIAITESVGAKATSTVTITVTATGVGTARFFMGEEFCDAPINTTDSATAVATAICAAINAKTHWAGTATNSAGVITITAKQKGLRGNWLRCSCVIISGNTGSIGTTSSQTVMTYFTGGTTADSNATSLNTTAGKKFYYDIGAAEDATQLGALVAQANSQALPTNNTPSRVFAGSVDTSGNAITIATGLNAVLCQIAILTQSDVPPCELAAHQAAVISLNERNFTSSSLNFNGYGQGEGETWGVPAPRSGAAPTPATLKSLIQNGLTPYAVSGLKTSMYKAVTTRTLSGSTSDYRAWHGHIPAVMHQLQFALQTKQALELRRKVIGDDPPPGAKAPGPNVITPNVYFGTIVRPVLEDFGGRDLLQNVDAIKAKTRTIRESTPRTRISCRIPTTVIDVLDSTATALDQM